MVAQYKYDPFGRRIEKNVNGNITTYFYDGPNIIAEYDGNGNVKNAYLHNLAIDDPLVVQQGGQNYYYHKDGLGSITEITDDSRNTMMTYRYNSFGEIVSQTGNLNQPFAFTGREFDLEGGLYYYRARYYDPKTGVFTSQDPIGFAGGDINLYRYAFNNPLTFTDPSGEIFPMLLVPYVAGVLLGTVGLGVLAPYFFDNVEPLPKGSPPGSLNPGLPGPVGFVEPPNLRGAPAACGPPIAGK